MTKDPQTVAQGRRLKEARRALFPKAARDAYHLVKDHISLAGFQHHESGQRSFKSMVDIYANAFDVSPAWLLWGHETVAPEMIRILGRAGAGPNGEFFSEYHEEDLPTLAPYPIGSVAVIVAGDSMEPRFAEGEVLIFGPKTDPSNCIGHEVLAELSDGRHLVKILRFNKHTGNWNLESHNNRHYAPIEDVQLNWTRQFIGMRA
jgi:hypothetical protein